MRDMCMKKSKRLISLLIITALAMGSFTGCGSSSSSSSKTSSKEATTASQNVQQGQPGQPPSGSAPGGSSSATITGTAAYSVSGQTASKSSQTYTASNSNESGVKASKSSTLTLTNCKIVTSGKTTSEDESNFYGLNAGILAESGSQITIKGGSVNTSGSGANGVFSTGSGSVINVSDLIINTTADSSRGLDATQTGTINATNVTVNTKGTHCAAIATDRGEGTINVTGGTFTTSGTDSPGIYSTGKITASNATITATGSEAAVVEGKNSITLTNTTLSGSNKNGVMLYQSTSGDAATGTSSFNMTGGSLSSKAGALFYATNTQCVVELKGVTINNGTSTLLQASADRWGNSGSNGGTMTFKADSETLTGNIICDKVSVVTASLSNSTTLKGAINTENKLANISLTLDSSSKWNVTETSYLKSLTDVDTTLSNIKDNGNTIYYDSSNSANSWLNGKTITLSGGGKLAPIK